MTVQERIQKNREMEARIAAKKAEVSKPIGHRHVTLVPSLNVSQISKEIFGQPNGMDPKKFERLIWDLLK